MTRNNNNNNNNLLIKHDIKYHSVLISRIINGLMISGNKEIIKKYIYKVLNLIRVKFLVNPLYVLNTVFNILRPIVGLRYKKVGGTSYNIPFKINEYRSDGIVIRWIKEIIINRVNISLVELLFRELINAFNGVGLLISKKNFLYKNVLHNRAFFYL